MTIIEYLQMELAKIAKDFPTVKIKCGYEEILQNTVVVELSDWNNPQLDERWIPLSINCQKQYPEDLVFTSFHSSLKIIKPLFKFNI